MNRHPANSNLTLYYGTDYLGMPLLFDVAPFVQQYLHRLHQTLTRALGQYRRVFAFRFDLRLPPGYYPQGGSYENEIIDGFIESFKAKIRHNRTNGLSSEQVRSRHHSSARLDQGMRTARSTALSSGHISKLRRVLRYRQLRSRSGEHV